MTSVIFTKFSHVTVVFGSFYPLLCIRGYRRHRQVYHQETYCNTSAAAAASSSPAAPITTPAWSQRKGINLAQGPRHPQLLLTCPRAVIPNPSAWASTVHCGWRHIQHGGQGDSVNISLSKNEINKALRRRRALRFRVRRTSELHGRVGFRASAQRRSLIPFIVFYFCILSYRRISLALKRQFL